MAADRPKALVVAPSAYKLSGLATWLDYALPGLTGRGWDVTLGLVSGRSYHRPDKYLAVHPFQPAIPIHCACGTPAGRTEAVRKAIRRVRPSLVLTVNIPDAIRAAAIERNRGMDVRAVMTCHGIQEDLFRDMELLSEQLDAVVCTNRLACHLAEEFGKMPRDRVYHARYGTAIPDELPPPPDNPVFTIGYAGRLEESQKRVHDLVLVALALRQQEVAFQFLMAGTGPEEAALRSRLEQHELTSFFDFLGFVSPDQMQQKVYPRADALLVTSSWETGPIVIWEAMGAGTPVVSSRYTGSGLERLLWREQNCLMFDVGDTEAAVCALQRATDRELREKLRVAAFGTVTSKLSCDVSVATWDGVLEAIAARVPRRMSKPPSIQAAPSGRLNRLLGAKGAHLLRRVLGRRPPDSGPGGEWPHTLTRSTMSDAEFLQLAAKLDEREEPVRV